MKMKKKLEAIVSLSVVALLALGCSNNNQPTENVVKVKTTKVTSTNISGEQNYSGSIEEMSGTSLSFVGAGTIKNLFVQEGQQVKAGQLIGVIDASSTNNAVTMAHAATEQAQETVRQANDAYNRMKLLRDNNSLPEIKWVEIETKVAQAKQMLTQAQASERIARKALTDTHITAPYSGYISKKNAEIGQNVMPGQPIANLVKIDKIKVKISVPENEVVKMHIGQKIMFKVSSLGETSFQGTIIEKNVAADPISRSYTVKAVADNPNHNLLPGMICEVYTSNSNKSMSISLPANIIQIDIDNRPFVWTVKNGKARKVYVDIDENAGENVIIKSGLQEGDKVITEGQQKVSNGMKIKE